MADSSNSKQQNQAFLQELEKQRVNKDCNRIIDLRGKVVGECQLYEFGGRQHYLDDRAYLLVKQLMAHFDGRYTIGVYEAVLKALKLLSQQDASPQRRHHETSFLTLDKTLERSEDRISFSTPINVRLDDVLYHGHTMDIASQAIRVAFKRTYSLQIDDIVRVEFSDFPQSDNASTATAATYQIIKLDHDDRYTTAVLRVAQQDNTFVEILEGWLSEHGAQHHLDVDDRLINLQSRLYQRLWLSHLSQPLLWLGSTQNSDPLMTIHVMPPADESYGADLFPTVLEQLPLMQLSDSAQDLIVVIDHDSSYSCQLRQEQSVKKLINWHLSRSDSRLLWLRVADIAFSAEETATEVAAISEYDADYAQHVAKTFKAIKRSVYMLDLSNSFQKSQASQPISQAQISSLHTLKTSLSRDLYPATLQPFIQRACSRFYIRTPVTLHVDDQQWQLETRDVSAQGMSLTLPAEADISPNQRMNIDFVRWQTLTKKVNLQTIPYQVKSKRIWNGEMRLGLQRIKYNCPESLNTFFDWVIAENQDKLRIDHNDVFQAAESRLYSQQLTPTLNAVPVFLGMDQTGQRDISLVGVTANNGAEQIDSALWDALRAELLNISDMLKTLVHTQRGLSTTLYAYQNKQQQWTIAFEQDFNHSRDKALFIERGISAVAFKAYHCVLHRLNGNETNKESDLSAQLMQLRTQRAHRVQQLRQQFSAVFGLMELNDISEIIKLFYQAD